MASKLEQLIAQGKNVDGDTVYEDTADGGHKGYRFTGFDSPEINKAHPNSKLAKNLTSALFKEGATLTPNGEYGIHGRELADMADAKGRSLPQDLIAGGMATPTTWSNQAEHNGEMVGNIRQAFGAPRTPNETINRYSQGRESVDDMIMRIGRNTMRNNKGISDSRGSLSRSWDRGIEDSKMALGGAINYLGDRLDSDIMRDYGRELFQEAEATNTFNGREVETYSEIDNISDAMTYGLETIGEALPGLIADGAAAAATAGASLPATIARRAGTTAIGKMLAGRMATGAGLSAGLQALGQTEAELEAHGSEDNPFAPVVSGAVSAAMTKLPVGVVLDRVLGTLDDKAAKTVGEKIIEGFKSAGTGASVELPTSAVESITNQLVQQFALNGQASELNYAQVVDDTLRGVLGGATFGGGAHLSATAVDAGYKQAKKRLSDFGDGYEKDEQGNQVEVPLDGGNERDDSQLGLNTQDVPNLSPEQYQYVADAIDTGGPVSLQKLKSLVERGIVSQGDVARYLADDVSGQDNQIIELTGLDAVKAENEQKLGHIVSDIRSGKVKLEKSALDAVAKADKSKLASDVAKAIDAVGSAYDPKGRHISRLDHRAMWQNYIERNKTAEPTVSNVDTDTGEVTDERNPPPDFSDVKREPPIPEPQTSAEVNLSEMGYMDFARMKAGQGDAIFKTALSYLDGVKNSPKAEDKKAATQLVRIITKRAKEGMELIRQGEDSSIADAISNGDERRQVSDTIEPETLSDADPFDDLTVSDLDGKNLTERERQVNREGFARQFTDLVEQLKELDGLSDVVPELDKFLRVVRADKLKVKEDEALNMAKGAKGSHPRKLSTSDAIQNEGSRPARLLNTKSIEKLNRLVKSGQYDKAVAQLGELGVFVEGHMVGNTPKRSVATALKQKTRSAKARLATKKISADDVITTVDQEAFVATDLVELGFNTDQITLRSDSPDSTIDGVNTRSEKDGAVRTNEGIMQAFMSGMSLAVDAGYRISFNDIKPSTIVYKRQLKDAKGKPIKDKFANVTYGQLIQSLKRSRKYRDGLPAEQSVYGERMGKTKGEGKGYGDERGDYLTPEDVFDDDLKMGRDDVTSGDPNENRAEFEAKETQTGKPQGFMHDDYDDRVKAVEGKVVPKSVRDKANKSAKKLFRYQRKKAVKGLFRFVEMISTRLDRIHPEIAKLAKQYTLNKQMKSEHFIAELRTIGDAKAIQKGYDDLIGDVDSAEARAYRKWINKVDATIRESVPNHQGKSSAVFGIDLQHLDANRQGFMEIIRKTDIADPVAFTEALFDGNGQPQWAINSNASNGTKSRLDQLESVAKELDAAGFLDKDAPRLLERYAHAASNWAMWNKYMGDGTNPNAKLDGFKAEVHPANLDELSKLMMGVTGKNTLGHSPYLNRFNSVALAFQTATILWFSAVASVPEIGSIVSRHRGDIDGLGGDVRKMLSGIGRAEATKFAADMGIISTTVTQHAMQRLYAMDSLSTGRASQKVTSMVFEYNGQRWLTETSRALAAVTGERFLDIHSTSDSVRSKRMLAELEIDAKTVKAYLKSKDSQSKEGRAYRDALHRFVNEAVTNPHESQLPLVATDPRFAVLTSLKKFFYGFYDNVHKSLYRDLRASGMEGSEAQAYKAMIITGLTLIPMAAISELIREFVKYPFGNPRGDRELGDFVQQTLMATGGLGPLSMAQLPYEMMQYGRNPAVTFAGPTVSYLNDWLNGSMTFERHVPIASQVPWAREMVKGARESITGE